MVTTATDVEGATAFDEVAKKNGLLIENLEKLKYVSGALLDKKAVQVVIDPLYRAAGAERTLYLRPQTLVLGVGCKKGMAPERMQAAFREFAEACLPMKEAVRAVATVDVKAGEEAIRMLAETLEVPMMIISRKMIAKLDFEKVPADRWNIRPLWQRPLVSDRWRKPALTLEPNACQAAGIKPGGRTQRRSGQSSVLKK